MTWSGVEPSKAGLGSLSQGPIASGETSFSNAAKRRLISVRRLPVDELGLDQESFGADGAGCAAKGLALGCVSGVVDLVPVFGEELPRRGPPLLCVGEDREVRLAGYAGLFHCGA